MIKITQIEVDGMPLRTRECRSTLRGLFSFDRQVVTIETLNDGAIFGRSKTSSKLPVLNTIIHGGPQTMLDINAVLSTNREKDFVITTREMGKLHFRADVQNRAISTTARAITCQLLMADPYIYEEEPQSIKLGSLYSTGVIFGAGHGVKFGEGYGVVFGAATGAGGVLINRGNTVAYPVITIEGPCSGIVVENKTTKEVIEITLALDEDDLLIIDCRPETRGVYLNGERVQNAKTGTGWIKCLPGENVFGFGRNSVVNKQHCTVSLQARWL